MPAFDSGLTTLILTAILGYLLGSIPFGVLVTKPHGPFVLRREYVVDDSQQASAAS